MPTRRYLPLEILPIIFLQAAESSTSSCRALCVVSSWVRHLALPILYRTVFIDRTKCDAFAQSIALNSLTCSPSPAFRPADALRHLWVAFGSKALKSIVSCCENITHLAISPQDLVGLIDLTPEAAGVHTRMGDLQVVLIPNCSYCPSFGRPVRTNPLLTRITHLHLEDPLRAAPWQLVAGMPRLTHLAIPWGYDEIPNRMPNKISNTSVKVLVIVLTHVNKSECQVVEDWVCELREEKMRVYAVRQHSQLEEWDTEVRGGTPIWERAAEYTQLLMNRTCHVEALMIPPLGLILSRNEIATDNINFEFVVVHLPLRSTLCMIFSGSVANLEMESVICRSDFIGYFPELKPKPPTVPITTQLRPGMFAIKYQLASENPHIDMLCDNIFAGEPVLFFLVGHDYRNTRIIQSNEGCDTITAGAGIMFDILRTDNPNVNANCVSIYPREVWPAPLC
ncbi:hypothetical protein BD779DRAFT_1471528 [Infundibulicybe gibba]|nr:hypothetical protein BD779DRAFT_1471528 [Infundibulicybe gibba]